MKIAINKTKPSFRLTDKQIEHYALLKNVDFKREFKDNSSFEYLSKSYITESFIWYQVIYYFDNQIFIPDSIPRNDPDLIKVLEESKDDSVLIIDIPDNTDFIIEDCNGVEWVSENHKTWGRS